MASPAFAPIRGRRPVLQNCTIAELEVDPRYQRSLENKTSRALVRRIAAGWDWSLCQPLVVARRPDGRLFVVDGQHRLAAARMRRDLWDLPCVVVAYDDPADEARGFVALNQARRPLGALDLFKAAVAAGDDDAVAVMSLIAAAGLELAAHTNFTVWRPGQISNIAGIRRAHRDFGDDVTSRALALLASAFAGQVLRYGGTIFPGIAAAIAETGLLADDDPLLGLVLAGAEQAAWAKEIAAIAADRGIHRNRAAGIAIRDALAEAMAELDEAA